jgi:hypothetical protein
MKDTEIVRDQDRGNYAADVAMAIAQEKMAKGSKLNLPLPIGRMLRCQTLTELIEQCGETAKDHGFWSAHVDTALKTMGLEPLAYQSFLAKFVFGNASKAQEDIVASLTKPQLGQLQAIWAFQKTELLGDPAIFLALIGTETAEAIEAARNGNWTKPSGVWEELADVAIRLFDFVARYSPNHEMTPEKFVQLIQGKMAVNEARPPKHGKNY